MLQYFERMNVEVFLLRKRVLIGAIVALISVILSVVCFILLPDRVTVNISLKGEASYMSKYIAIMFPLALCIITLWIYVHYHSIFNKNVDLGKTKGTEDLNKIGENEEVKEAETVKIITEEKETKEIGETSKTIEESETIATKENRETNKTKEKGETRKTQENREKSEQREKSEVRAESETREAVQNIALNEGGTAEDCLKDGMKYLIFSVVGVLLTLWILFKNI